MEACPCRRAHSAAGLSKPPSTKESGLRRTGVHVSDDGTITLDGVPYQQLTPRQSQALGVSIIFQDLKLIGLRSIASSCCTRARQSASSRPTPSTTMLCSHWRTTASLGGALRRIRLLVDNALLLALGLLVLFFASQNDRFVSFDNFRLVLLQVSIMGIVSGAAGSAAHQRRHRPVGRLDHRSGRHDEREPPPQRHAGADCRACRGPRRCRGRCRQWRAVDLHEALADRGHPRCVGRGARPDVLHQRGSDIRVPGLVHEPSGPGGSWECRSWCSLRPESL